HRRGQTVATVLVVVEAQSLLARVTLRRRMGLVAADPLEGAPVGTAETYFDPAVALTQDARRWLPLGLAFDCPCGVRHVIVLRVVAAESCHDASVPSCNWNLNHRVPTCNPLRYPRDMRRTDTSDWPCTIARSVDVLGDHWNLLIIRQACLGTRRFD